MTCDVSEGKGHMILWMAPTFPPWVLTDGVHYEMFYLICIYINDWHAATCMVMGDDATSSEGLYWKNVYLLKQIEMKKTYYHDDDAPFCCIKIWESFKEKYEKKRKLCYLLFKNKDANLIAITCVSVILCVSNHTTSTTIFMTTALTPNLD